MRGRKCWGLWIQGSVELVTTCPLLQTPWCKLDVSPSPRPLPLHHHPWCPDHRFRCSCQRNTDQYHLQNKNPMSNWKLMFLSFFFAQCSSSQTQFSPFFVLNFSTKIALTGLLWTLKCNLCLYFCKCQSIATWERKGCFLIPWLLSSSKLVERGFLESQSKISPGDHGYLTQQPKLRFK